MDMVINLTHLLTICSNIHQESMEDNSILKKSMDWNESIITGMCLSQTCNTMMLAIPLLF